MMRVNMTDEKKVAVDVDKAIDRTLGVLLAEYKQANEEIAARLKMQKQVERLVLVIVGALIAGAAFILEYRLFVILPLTSIVFCILTISFFEQDINITVLASYCHNVLRKKLQAAMRSEGDSHELLEWESFRKEAFLKASVSKYLTINRTSLLYIPPALPLAAFLYLKFYSSHMAPTWSVSEIAAMGGAFLGLLVIAYFAVEVPRLYNNIVRPDSD
jgi:hypothetical protein